MQLNEQHIVKSLGQLREVISEPPELLGMKVLQSLDDDAREFVAEAPLIFLCTQDGTGAMDVSPKGDAPGFVEVADETTLIVPDRPGNKLAYGFRNLLECPELSLIFVRPGIRETLRINGTGQITRDPQILERFAVNGKPAVLCTVVTVRECFFHCGKALIRSKLWQPDSWAAERKISFGKQFARLTGGDKTAAEQIDSVVADDYANNLY